MPLVFDYSKSISVSGPQSQTSDPSVSTKTGPAGTVTTTTTNNYQYNYAGDTINYTVNQTTVTQPTAPDGTTETTTETSDKTPEKTNCELYPKSIGCMELGEAEEGEIPEREEELELSPEDVALPSGCPADLSLPGGRVVSYASVARCEIGGRGLKPLKHIIPDQGQSVARCEIGGRGLKLRIAPRGKPCDACRPLGNWRAWIEPGTPRRRARTRRGARG